MYDVSIARLIPIIKLTLLEYSPSNGTLIFGNNNKSKIEIYFNQKTLTKNMFLKFVYVFINAGIGWNFNILNVLC